MTQQEYESQKRKCWEEFTTMPLYKAFNFAFDRAYALGKEKETITQEEIGKAAEESANNFLNGYRIDDMLRDDLRDDMIKLFKDAVDFSLGKQEKDADTVIQGWVAIDEAYGQCFLHTEKPIQKAQPIADTGDYDTVWDSNGKTYLIDAGLFSDMDSDSKPQECEIIIKRKKNG